MRKNYLKAIALVICLTLVLAITGGCGGSKATEESTSASVSSVSKASTAAESSAAGGLDTSKEVELQFWMLGNAAADLPLIQDEVNKMAKTDLNCTVKFNFTTWTDWAQKYKLLLTSGEKIDLIFTAEWTDYQRYAKSGAFLPLDEILPKAAPALNSFITK